MVCWNSHSSDCLCYSTIFSSDTSSQFSSGYQEISQETSSGNCELTFYYRSYCDSFKGGHFCFTGKLYYRGQVFLLSETWTGLLNVFLFENGLVMAPHSKKERCKNDSTVIPTCGIGAGAGAIIGEISGALSGVAASC